MNKCSIFIHALFKISTENGGKRFSMNRMVRSQWATGGDVGDVFQRYLAEPKLLGDATAERLEKAFATLTELVARKEQLVRVNVEPGASLHHAVSAALTEVGRAFGAARVAALG